MENEIKTVKGFKDFTGEEALKRERIKQIIVEKFRTYGFEPAETPIIEYEEFAKKDQWEETISDIFRLEDKGKRKLALRYELTFQLKRITKGKKLPYRRYQIGEVFRDEPVSANRFRQFTQCDIDIVGATIREEAEVLKVFSEILKELKINYDILVNNRKLLEEFLQDKGVKEEETKEIMKELDKIEKIGEEEVARRLEKFGAGKIVNLIKRPILFKKYPSFEEIKKLTEYCKIFGVKIKFSPSLSRGLLYYIGNVFEIKSKKIKESIAGGGTYLVNGIRSTGISFGLERICSLAKVETEGVKCLLISIQQEEKTIKLMEELRAKGISCFMLDKLTKGLEYANSKKIPYVVFVGKEEIKRNRWKLRNMKTGKEIFLTTNELVKLLKS